MWCKLFPVNVEDTYLGTFVRKYEKFKHGPLNFTEKDQVSVTLCSTIRGRA